MVKVPQVKVGASEEDDDAFADAPTEKRSVPAELLSSSGAPPVRITTKLRKVEIDQLVAKEKSEAKGSGMHPRFEDPDARGDADSVAARDRRGAETLPAPPETDPSDGVED